jgi:hypothetical protein
MEISPISAVRLAPAFRSRETDLGLTDVFDVENSARIGDETYSPGGNGAASGFDDDEDKGEEQEATDTDSDTELKPKEQKTSGGATQEINFFA